MARSRRSFRTSTSQQATSLLASALPSPLRQIAGTQFGSTLMTLGIPALVVGGILQFNWEGGFPHLTIDPNRAAELEQAARNEIGRIGNPGAFQQRERTAVEFWNNAQGQQSSYGSSPYPNDSGFTSPQPTTNNQYDWRSQTQAYPIPSSSAAKYVSTQTPPPSYSSTNAYPNSSQYQPQTPQPSTYNQPYPYQQSQAYPQQQYYQQPQPPNYQPPQQQPYYQQPAYQQSQSYQSQNNGQWRQ